MANTQLYTTREAFTPCLRQAVARRIDSDRAYGDRGAPEGFLKRESGGTLSPAMNLFWLILLAVCVGGLALDRPLRTWRAKRRVRFFVLLLERPVELDATTFRERVARALELDLSARPEDCPSAYIEKKIGWVVLDGAKFSVLRIKLPYFPAEHIVASMDNPVFRDRVGRHRACWMINLAKWNASWSNARVYTTLANLAQEFAGSECTLVMVPEFGELHLPDELWNRLRGNQASSAKEGRMPIDERRVNHAFVLLSAPIMPRGEDIVRAFGS